MQTRDCIPDEFRDEWIFDVRRKNWWKKTWCTHKEKLQIRKTLTLWMSAI